LTFFSKLFRPKVSGKIFWVILLAICFDECFWHTILTFFGEWFDQTILTFLANCFNEKLGQSVLVLGT
jgi:hypothetical protein